MPVYKSVQYAVYCSRCDNLDDFASFSNLREAEKYWRSRGWRKTRNGEWVCPRHRHTEETADATT